MKNRSSETRHEYIGAAVLNKTPGMPISSLSTSGQEIPFRGLSSYKGGLRGGGSRVSGLQLNAYYIIALYSTYSIFLGFTFCLLYAFHADHSPYTFFFTGEKQF